MKKNGRKAKTTSDERTEFLFGADNDENDSAIPMFEPEEGYIIKQIVKECASGLNDKRPKLEWILENQEVTRIIVEHKDRLIRFGFRYIEIIAKHKQCEIEVINEVGDGKDDLIQDFVAIITSFTARVYGLRRSRRKTEKIIKELKDAP